MKKLFTLFLATFLFILTGCEGLKFEYTVSYDSDYGKQLTAIKVVDGTVLTAKELPNLYEEGYNFEGWYDGTTKALPNVYTVTRDVTLKAKWTVEPVLYEVSFFTEHGSAPTKIRVKENSKLTAAQLPQLTANGFIFKGWYDGTLEVKANEYIVVKNVTLSAKWEVAPISTYIVSYSTEKGTAPEQITVNENTILTADELPQLTADGFTFLGWFIDNTKINADEYAVTKDITLTAKWEIIPPKTFTVTYATEQGILPIDSITVNENTILTAQQLPSFSYPGYTFLGWYDGTTKAEPGVYVVTKNVTLMAKWETVQTVTSVSGNYELLFETEDSMEIPLRYEFNTDNTIYTYAVMDLGFGAPTFLYYKGTYEINNHAVNITYNDTQFSTSTGLFWENIEDDQLGMAIQVLDIINNLEIEYNNNKLQYNNGTNFVDLELPATHENIIAAWENETEQHRIYIDTSSTFKSSMVNADNSILYTKGKCMIIGNYLQLVPNNKSSDYDTWEEMTKTEVYNYNLTGTFAINNNVLTFNDSDYTKMEGTDITYTLPANNTDISGSYDFVLNDSGLDIPLRYIFNSDETVNAIAVFDSSIIGGNSIIFYYYKGTYSIAENDVTVTFDETQFSISNGKEWKNPEEDQMGIYLSMLDVLKAFEFKVDSNNKLQYCTETDFEDCPAASLTDSELTGAWENEDHDMRMLFNDDNSLYIAEDSYAKGEYVIINGILQIVCTDTSEDFENWTHQTSPMNMVFPYSITNNTLNVGQNYTKMSSTTITW